MSHSKQQLNPPPNSLPHQLAHIELEEWGATIYKEQLQTVGRTRNRQIVDIQPIYSRYNTAGRHIQPAFVKTVNDKKEFGDESETTVSIEGVGIIEKS